MTHPSLPSSITIATRGSTLALWQAKYVEKLICAMYPNTSVNTLIIKTKGDIILDRPLAEIGGKGLFVKEIEEALLNGKADLAVHSMKDVPMDLPNGLVIGALCERGPIEDVFMSFHHSKTNELPPGARVGSSSMRRKAQMLMLRPDVEILPLRGNIATRIAKLERNEYDAIILAKAGIDRLEISTPYMEILDKHSFVPAAGQGALGVELLETRKDLIAMLTPLEHLPTRICVESERAFVREMGAGCHAPIAAHAWLDQNGKLRLEALLTDEYGKTRIGRTKIGIPEKAAELGVSLAKELRLESEKQALCY